MNEPIDDKAFDDYLGRKTQVSSHYQALEGLDVPSEIDRRVLDQAARAVEKKQRGKAQVWKKWSVPVALAASTVLTLAVVIESGIEPKPVTAPELSAQQPLADEPASFSVDRIEDSTSESDLPGAASPPAISSEASASAPQDARGSSQMKQRDAESKVEASQRPTETTIEQVAPARPRAEPAAVQSSPLAGVSAPRGEPSGGREESTAQPAPVIPSVRTISQIAAPRPVAAPPPAQPQSAAAPGEAAAARDPDLETRNEAELESVTLTGQRRQERTIVGPRGTLMRQTAPGADSQAEAEEQRREDDPARWLEYIRELRRDRKTEEADRQWSEFRKVYPEYAVAETDSARPQR